ncbi:MAG: MmcQ/YjbR family DNA-binding protein [Tannerella sp.]|jgi:predicted DNA-binding protein (MmcQ/YjbR family)|nr:MmcQ/YjbR family DNA-binding protein [Tannerella sp.]
MNQSYKSDGMDYGFIQSHCLSKKGAEEDYKQAWDAIRYAVRGKIFALVGYDGEGHAVISVKHTPEQGEALREKYNDILPGYHLNKTHWSSVLLSGKVPEAVLKRMLDDSYELIFRSLSKKTRNDILNQQISPEQNK